MCLWWSSKGIMLCFIQKLSVVEIKNVFGLDQSFSKDTIRVNLTYFCIVHMIWSDKAGSIYKGHQTQQWKKGY